jgi:hypothetical protein
MTDTHKRLRHDPNQLAKAIIDIATGGQVGAPPTTKTPLRYSRAV